MRCSQKLFVSISLRLHIPIKWTGDKSTYLLFSSSSDECCLFFGLVTFFEIFFEGKTTTDSDELELLDEEDNDTEVVYLRWAMV
jgi:hypothetical protein